MGKNSGPCSVEPCDRPAQARGWCRMHYRRAWAHGDPATVLSKGRPRKPAGSKEKAPKKPRLCGVGGCTDLVVDKVNAKYCTTHHEISVRTKNPPRTVWKPTDEEYFWSKVVKAGDDECWKWIGAVRQKENSRAYGQFNFKSKQMSAHRYSYQLATGETLVSHTPVHHTCSETLCVNPKHLQATTPHENTAEMLERRWYKARIVELEGRVAELESQLNT